MRESTAWRILAEEHDAGRSGSTFLCNALQLAGREWGNKRLAAIPVNLRREMKARIESALGQYGAPAYEANVPYDEWRPSRVLACLMFAEISRDEERA